MGTPQWDADEMGKAIPEQLREKFKTNHVKVRHFLGIFDRAL